MLREQDLRGWVEGKGWAHAIAHGADALGALAGSPHLGPNELQVILEVLTERATSAGPRFVSGESDRLAAATLSVIRRNRLPLERLEPWLRDLGDAATVRMDRQESDPFAEAGNADAYLRALYLQLVFGSRPPELRADLVLLVVDVLKDANPHYLS